jgi:hypothetical protein
MKIALCFLTYDNLSQPKLWSKIFYNINNKDKLNVYIHNKIPFVDKKYNLHKYCIKNKIKTQHGTNSLVEATLLLLKSAFLHDNINEYFILLSDKCIPLYNFNFIYNKIGQINSNIISCVYGNIERYDDINDKTFFDKDHFFKQSQWCLLKRETVKFFIENNFLHRFNDMFYALDEHYFVNICNKFDIKYENFCITYVNWCDKNEDPNERDQPKTYIKLTNQIANKIIQENPCFFMRKISKSCILPTYFHNIS